MVLIKFCDMYGELIFEKEVEYLNFNRIVYENIIYTVNETIYYVEENYFKMILTNGKKVI